MNKKLVLICAVLFVAAFFYAQPFQSSYTEEDTAYEEETVMPESFLKATKDILIPSTAPHYSEDSEADSVYRNSASAPINGGNREIENRHFDDKNMHGGEKRPGHRPPPSGNSPGNRPPLDEWRTRLIIESNVSGAQVYLNRIYYGTTPLTVQNIMPGTYEVLLFMEGYEKLPQRIRVFNGHETSYFIPMQKRTGFLQVTGIDGEFLVYSDGKLLHDSINRIDEGYHTIKIRKFGYEDLQARIHITAHRLKKITVSLKEADFRITSFSAHKKSFNPTYEGSVGSCAFEAEVTAPGSGTLSISDSNGTIVFEHMFPRFTSWSQHISWQGTDANGELLPQGVYTAVFSARGLPKKSGDNEEFSARTRTSINYTLVYHLADITEGGLGFGSTPAALIMPKGAPDIQMQVSPIFNLKNNAYQVPIGLALCVVPIEFMDISGKISFIPEKDDFSFAATIAIRFLFSKELAKSRFNYGFSVEYGWSNNSKFFPYGIATGAGLTPTVMIGFDSEKLFFGLTTQCAFGALSSNPIGGDSVWKNSLAFSFKPTHLFSLDIAASLHSAFGNFESYGGEGFECDWTRAVELFAGMSAMLPQAPLIFKLGLKSYIYPTGGIFTGFSAGMNYFFLK